MIIIVDSREVEVGIFLGITEDAELDMVWNAHSGLDVGQGATNSFMSSKTRGLSA